jgi:hypothetical protein
MILFRPVGIDELRLIAGSDFRSFPPRLPQQPIFYPVLVREYAEPIAREWNATAPGHAGFVTRFEIDDTFASRYPVQVVGDRRHQELWTVISSAILPWPKRIRSKMSDQKHDVNYRDLHVNLPLYPRPFT